MCRSTAAKSVVLSSGFVRRLLQFHYVGHPHAGVRCRDMATTHVLDAIP